MTDLQANKAKVIAFYELMFNCCRPREAIERYAGLLNGEMGSSLPDAARPMFLMMLDMLDTLNTKISELDKEIARRAREDAIAKRLMTIPGVEPIWAVLINQEEYKAPVAAAA